MARLWMVVSLTLALAGEAYAQAAVDRLTLDEAVALATRENPVLRAKEFELRAVQASEVTAALRPNPTASYSSEQFAFGRATDAVQQHTASLSQLIETGGKRQRRIDSARAATQVTGAELADVRRQVVYQVRKAFTDIFTARANLALAEQGLRTLDDVERLQRFRAERGDISELELLRIQVQRFAFERDATDARAALRAGVISLRAVLGPQRVSENVDVVGDLTYREITRSRDDLEAAALANRPDLRAAEATRARARADYSLARANASWDFAPMVEYQRIGADNTIGFGISMPLRVFDRNQGEIERTRAEVDRADALRDATVLQTRRDVASALATVVSEGDKLRLLREVYLPKAQQARDTVEFAYRRGGVSLLDFLDAQRTYRETALEQVRALGNYVTAIDLLEAAVGIPVTESR
jgi:cobalt-zinc-cadmium efflux system outer membrane protein